MKTRKVGSVRKKKPINCLKVVMGKIKSLAAVLAMDGETLQGDL